MGFGRAAEQHRGQQGLGWDNWEHKVCVQSKYEN